MQVPKGKLLSVEVPIKGSPWIFENLGRKKVFPVPRPQLQQRPRNRPAVSLTTRTCHLDIRRPCSRWRPHGHPKLVHGSRHGRLLYSDIPQLPQSLVHGAARASAKATGPVPLPRGVNRGCAPVAIFAVDRPAPPSRRRALRSPCCPCRQQRKRGHAEALSAVTK